MISEQTCRNILIWGGGSKARIIELMINELEIGNVSVIFDPVANDSVYKNDPRYATDFNVLSKSLAFITHFIVCIGNNHGLARARTSESLEAIGLKPLTVVHDTAWLDKTVITGRGLQIMPRATVHKLTRIGEWSIVNTAAVVDHECYIGSGVHLMGSCALAGRVTVGDWATIGTNATVLPDVTIGSGAYVGAGAVVTSSVSPNTVVVGIPARILRTTEPFDPGPMNEQIFQNLSYL